MLASRGAVMLITRTSPFTGKVHAREIDIDAATLYKVDHRKQLGLMIQDIVPHLTADDREFLMTGITPAEWQQEFGTEEKNG